MLRNTAEKISAVILTISAVSACVIRFFQLLNFTDSKTGLIYQNERLVYVFYLLVLICFVCSAIFSVCKKQTAPVFENQGGESLFLPAVFLCITFFFDFIHQCYNCFVNIQGSAYVQYTYVVPLGLSGLFALLCSFYFFTMAVTARNGNYDFKNFILFHFMPVLWAFTRLLIIMTEIVDIKTAAETVCEFALLVFFLLFFICFISSVDKRTQRASGVFIFSFCAVCVLYAVKVMPRAAVILSGNGRVLYDVDFTLTAYMALGIFSAFLLWSVNKRARG